MHFNQNTQHTAPACCSCIFVWKGQTKHFKCCKITSYKLWTSKNVVALPPFFPPAKQKSSPGSKGQGLLAKLKVSAELLIAIAALLSWAVVGVVMFNFVEYKTVPGGSTTRHLLWILISGLCFIPLFCSADIQQIITDPVQAVNDAVDEVSSLLGKFQGEDKLSNSSF